MLEARPQQVLLDCGSIELLSAIMGAIMRHGAITMDLP